MNLLNNWLMCSESQAFPYYLLQQYATGNRIMTQYLLVIGVVVMLPYPHPDIGVSAAPDGGHACGHRSAAATPSPRPHIPTTYCPSVSLTDSTLH